MPVTLPYLWVSTNAGFPYNDIMHKWQTHAHCYYFSISHLPIPYPLFSFPLILKMDRLPPEVFTHRHLTSFMSCATTSKRKQIPYSQCVRGSSPQWLLFPTQAYYYGTVKGPDSKATLKGVSALPREKLIHPHRACSVSRNPGSGQWLSPC